MTKEQVVKEIIHERDEARAEIEWLNSWAGLMWILDAHWPESMCPTTREREEHLRDPGPRIVALLRWVDELKAEVERLTTKWEVTHE